MDVLVRIHNYVENLQTETGKEPMLEVLPTKNGYHMITRPFNLSKFKLLINDLDVRLDVHKDNPTILYCP